MTIAPHNEKSMGWRAYRNGVQLLPTIDEENKPSITGESSITKFSIKLTSKGPAFMILTNKNEIGENAVNPSPKYWIK